MPELRGTKGPKYRAIADAILEAVAMGDLESGEKLPPQRNLAYDLGVTLGTVTRAYQEVERAGVARGEVGRGTFILPPEERSDAKESEQRFWYDTPPVDFETSQRRVDQLYSDPATLQGGYELNGNYPAIEPSTAEVMATAMRRVARPDLLGGFLQYQSHHGVAYQRQAAANWMADRVGDVDSDRILITQGAQNATQVSLVSLTHPGDTILAEELTWPSLRATADPLGLRLKGVAMDEHGMRPDAFEEACRLHAPKLAYLLPSLHNPTTGIMPEDRRRDLVEIAERFNVYLLEDDIYGFLLDERQSPFIKLSPRLGIYITALSKSVAPALRVGYIIAPDGLMTRFVGAMRTTVLMASALTGAIASELIETGAAHEIAAQRRLEMIERQALASKLLGHLNIRTHPSSTHLWLPVPSAFQNEQEFRTRLLERGVSVSPGHVFAIDDDRPLTQDHVRICLGAEQDRDRLKRALGIVAEVARRNDLSPMPVV